MDDDFLLRSGKEKYLDLVEIAVGAYPEAQVADYVAAVARDGLQEHGFARLAANIGFLLAHGRGAAYARFFAPMMDLCCAQMPGNLPAANNFTVKEVVLCLRELERSGRLPPERLDGWKAKLAAIVPETTYRETTHNWNVFSAASEQARIMAGLSQRGDYVERQIAGQLARFDVNGMYRDGDLAAVPPQHPLVYDLVTRLQFAVALFCGYDGPSRPAVERFLRQSGEPTLRMQAATGEIPYGGRSNGFLHNDTCLAALCEFYAAWCQHEGDRAAAGRFKAAAHAALGAVAYWLRRPAVRHVKNRFPVASQFGCEGYAYFNKYMVTMGSWACLAYWFADEAVAPAAASRPAASVFVSSADFHVVVLNAGEYTAQFDAPADPHYDGDGLGRVVRHGAPSFLALAYPFAVAPNYGIGAPNPTPLALTPGARAGDGWEYAYAGPYRLRAAEAFPEKTACEAGWDVTLPSGKTLVLRVAVAAAGVTVVLEGAGEIALAFPVFVGDGESQATLRPEGAGVTTVFAGWACHWDTDGTLCDDGREYRNRNGVYRRHEARASGKLTLRCALARV